MLRAHRYAVEAQSAIPVQRGFKPPSSFISFLDTFEIRFRHDRYQPQSANLEGSRAIALRESRPSGEASTWQYEAEQTDLRAPSSRNFRNSTFPVFPDGGRADVPGLIHVAFVAVVAVQRFQFHSSVIVE